jgi:hypothetical protein
MSRTICTCGTNDQKSVAATSTINGERSRMTSVARRMMHTENL